MSGSIPLSDIAGLSEPLSKLIETVGAGVGAIYEPTKIRKKAKAEGDALIIKAKADEKVKEIEYRSSQRIKHLELRRQRNIEKIVGIAREQLPEKVSGEKVDEDWTVKFFNYSQDVGNEELQIIWGRILAGEVNKPKSFSLRTLELLKNLTQEEAQLFSKFGQFAIFDMDQYFVINPDNHEYISKELGISFMDILKLRELNLLTSIDLNAQISSRNETYTTYFRYGNKCILLEKEPNSPMQSITAIVFSSIGRELLKLLDISINNKYLDKFLRIIKNDSVNVKVGDVVNWDASVLNYDNLYEYVLPNNSEQGITLPQP